MMNNLMKFINPETGVLDEEWLNNEVEIYAINNSEALWQEIVREDGLPIENLVMIAFSMVADKGAGDDLALLDWLDEYGDGMDTLAPTIERLQREREEFEED